MNMYGGVKINLHILISALNGVLRPISSSGHFTQGIRAPGKVAGV
jgi:hypothetical protein